ncbi:MAG: rRNA pseudouridine synthase [bacterium]|nr:MAG: rRNA pseudouridine synthase [bacterium]
MRRSYTEDAMASKVRINRFLAAAGLGSRRKCEDLIRAGLVCVNGQKVDRLARLVDPDNDVITVDGEKIAWNQKKIILVLNKPEGVLSTVSDSFNRKTVIDLAREHGYTERLFPVGRLDLDTSGIIIITNDGELAYRLMHPRFKIEKRYIVTVEGRVSQSTIDDLVTGVVADDFVTQPCTIRVLKRGSDTTELDIRLKEGMKRQIKRMFGLYGHTVVKLKRVALGGMEFGDVEIGDIRPLTPAEERHLRRLAKLA